MADGKSAGASGPSARTCSAAVDHALEPAHSHHGSWCWNTRSFDARWLAQFARLLLPRFAVKDTSHHTCCGGEDPSQSDGGQPLHRRSKVKKRRSSAPRGTHGTWTCEDQAAVQLDPCHGAAPFLLGTRALLGFVSRCWQVCPQVRRRRDPNRHAVHVPSTFQGTGTLPQWRRVPGVVSRVLADFLSWKSCTTLSSMHG